MVYKERFVAVVKCNNKIMREFNKDIIKLPFDSEYSLLFKNLESRRVVVDVNIDGQDVLFGKQLVINPNSELELKRFVDNISEGNRFKFIKKTQQIVEHRGDRIDDGIIRISFAFELKKIMTNNDNISYNYHPTYYGGSPGNVKLMSSVVGANYCSSINEQLNINKDEGLTVQGSRSNQHFNNTYVGTVESSNVIILRLKGITNSDQYIKKPITVKTKLRCATCGKFNKFSSNFCSECGTNLEFC